MPVLRTVGERVVVTVPPIKGSRFEGQVARVGSAAEARAVAASVRQTYPKATHVAAAWRIRPSDYGHDDDGEVAGTAGKPILDRLVGLDLQEVVVVVTRWYGGTKLGKGGLIRAYGGTATATLEKVEIVEEVLQSSLVVTCPHALVGPLRGVVAAHGGEVVDAAWGADAALTIRVPQEHAGACRAALVERSAGRAKVEG